MGHNVPSIAFQQGGAQTLSLKLHFDTQDAGSDVRAFTAPLWDMMMVDETNENQTTGKGQPPPVAFSWGSLYFRSIITQMSETFSLFSDQGLPLRSEISISLQQYVDEATPAPQTGSTGSAQPAPRSTVVQSGDRIDTVSNNLNGGSSNWRDVAEANNVDNPLNMRRGTSMRSGG
jgi:hypothetical protein